MTALSVQKFFWRLYEAERTEEKGKGLERIVALKGQEKRTGVTTL